MRLRRSCPVRPNLGVLTAFGAVSAAVMVVAYALEARHPVWIAVFAAGCASTALYGVLTRSWIFVVLEVVWSALAIRRYLDQRTTT